MASILYLLPNEEVKSFYEEVSHQHSDDSGVDLVFPNQVVIKAGTYGNKVGLGIRAMMAVSQNGLEPHAYRLALRSSTGKNTPLRLSNNEGIIDVGYRGEICALFDNWSTEDYVIQAGSRLVQLLSPNLVRPEIVLVQSLPESSRGEGGFGSTTQ